MSFICRDCAKKNYEPFFVTRVSYGRCEERNCGKVGECLDVPKSIEVQLKRKKRRAHA